MYQFLDRERLGPSRSVEAGIRQNPLNLGAGEPSSSSGPTVFEGLQGIHERLAPAAEDRLGYRSQDRLVPCGVARGPEPKADHR